MRQLTEQPGKSFGCGVSVDSDSGSYGKIAAMPREHKGDRHPHTVRIPLEQHDHYAAEAKRLGMDYGSYLVWKLAKAHGLKPTERPRAARKQLDLMGDKLMAS